MDTTEPSPDAHLSSVNAELSTKAYLKSMWDRREFAVEVPLEQLRVAHQTTLLGNIWHLGNPLLMVAVYFIIFGVVFQARRDIDHFLVWLTIGVFAFQLTSKTVRGGAQAITGNAGLIRAIRFPRALLPVSLVIAQLLTFGIELGVMAAMTLVSGVGISRRWLVLPIVVIIHTSLNLGGAFITARLNDTFKDVEQLIPFLFRLLMYFSGVMFPLDLLIERMSGVGWLATVADLNPIGRILDLYRWVFLGTSLDNSHLLITALMSGLLLWFGFRYFKAAEVRYGRA